MPNVPYFKFPSTPHLLSTSGNITRTDKIMSGETQKIFLSNPITIEEKIDGANLGISFRSSGELQLQNRGQYLSSPHLGQWKKLSNWLSTYQDMLFDILEDKYILFGEWCYARHSIYYTSLPNWFIAFDVYDIGMQKFFSVLRRDRLLLNVGLPVVPQIWHGTFALEDIPGLLCQSAYGDSLCEGLYFRYDVGDWLQERAKYVRNTFSQSIDQHWKKGTLQKNKLCIESPRSIE